MRSLPVRLAVVLVTQLALVGLAVAPQLSARLTGDEVLLRVEPYDPIDPFRGAYVDLTYPDLGLNDPEGGPSELDRLDGTRVFITLREEGDVWVAARYSVERPDDTLYLACDHHTWQLSCGIESWFLPQEDAAEFQDLVSSGDAVARVRIDSRGNAALIGVDQG